jgi:hypothetical protein
VTNSCFALPLLLRDISIRIGIEKHKQFSVSPYF